MKTNYYLTDRQERSELDIDKFISNVAIEFGYDKERIVSTSREAELVNMRKILMHFIHNRSLINNNAPTFNITGSFFKGESRKKIDDKIVMVQDDKKRKNHASVMNLCKRHKELREIGDEEYNYIYIRVEQVYERLTNYKATEHRELMNMCRDVLNTSKLIRVGRFIAENYWHNEELRSILGRDRQMDLLSKEMLENKPEEAIFAVENCIED
jgi:hypothetical protein